MADSLTYTLDRSVLIAATPDVVFRFFTDSARWAAWWGPGSTVDASPGGTVYIRHRDGTESGGTVVESTPATRFVFTYGFQSGRPFPPGKSLVTITLAQDKAGTRLHLHHDLPDEAARNEHVQGWRFQLSLFANVVADELNAGLEGAVDAWFDAWADPDVARREVTLRRIAGESIRFQDRFSNLDGLADLMPHIAATQHFMPGLRLLRVGPVRHCQGVALCDWVARGADGREQGKGTNTFVLGPTGRIERVTGFWAAPGTG